MISAFDKIQVILFMAMACLLMLALSYDNLYIGFLLCASVVLTYVMALSLASNALVWYGTLFWFIAFAFIEFAAMIGPLLFERMPFYRFFEGAQEATDYFITYLLVFLFGFSLLVTGYTFGKRIRPSTKRLVCDTFPLIACIIPFLVSMLCFIKIFHEAGGILSAFVGMSGRNVLLADLAALASFAKVGYISPVMFMLTRRYILCVASFLIITVFMAGIGERGAVLFSGLIPLLIAYRLYRGKINSKYILLLLSVFIAYYLVVGAVRGRQSSKDNESFSEKVVEVVSKTEHHVNAAATIKMAEKDGFYYGKTLINLVYVPMPRAMWPQKPVTSESAAVGMQLKGVSSPAGAGLPPGLFAYGYLQFGLGGVFLIALIAGIFSGVIEKYFLANRSLPNVLFYSQSQSMFVYIFSTEVQVKLIINIIMVLMIFFVSSVLSGVSVRGGGALPAIRPLS